MRNFLIACALLIAAPAAFADCYSSDVPPGTVRGGDCLYFLKINSDGSLNTSGVTGVAQGSTTSGQSGALVQGAVTTAAPTYTTGQTDPISLTTGGGLRIDFSSVGGSAVITAASGNGVTGTGLPASASYGQYVALASQPALTNGQYGSAQLDTAGNQKITLGAPAIANILAGRQTFTSTTGATTLITITAGKTWIGTIGASVDCNSAAALATACKANATFTTVGANITPAAGTYFACQATSGANAATGTVGSQGANFCSMPFIASCASGSCTIAVTTTQAGTASLVEASASGVMQ